MWWFLFCKQNGQNRGNHFNAAILCIEVVHFALNNNILKYQRCNFNTKSKKYIQVFVDGLLHHKIKEERKRAITIVSKCKILSESSIVPGVHKNSRP